ncbi:MAG: LEA type 2 family protein [Vicingaceae bacterium]|nr:LEA type 2 family protein [Vicingaceae bacterium]
MLRNSRFYIGLIILLISFSGCIEYKEVEVVEVSGVGIKNISLKGIEVEVAMQIKNPNKYNISIVDSDLTLFADGKKVGIARVKEKITLPKKSNKIHRFTIQTSVQDIVSNALPLLMNLMTQDNIEIGIKGDIKAKAKGVGKRFPVDFKERVKI